MVAAASLICALSQGCTTSGSNPAPVDTTTHVAEAPQTARPQFNPDTAMRYLKRQVDFGPRVPGTAAHKACADWLAETLRGMGAKVDDAVRTAPDPAGGTDIPVRNIFARFNPQEPRRVILMAHYDTRPWADNDPVEANRARPIDGANDGASGVAVALELARLFSLSQPSVGIDVLLTDCEDGGNEGDDNSWCIGATLWAERAHTLYTQAPLYAVLLDMVGGKDATFGREYYSDMYASFLNDRIQAIAASGPFASRFVNEVTGGVNDDHLPLLRIGIPAVDIIELGHPATGAFNPTWHTMADNMSNIDPETVRAVGTVIAQTIYDEK